MTADARIDGRLTEILEELYLGRIPDYEHEVVAGAVAHRQRPAWAFPGRWLPMTDITRQRVEVPRISLRTIGVALVLIVLLLAAALVAGSRQGRVPAPFGVAHNGAIAYSIYGDIQSTDIVTGTTTPITSGPELDSLPLFSRDGTKIAFLRATGTTTPYELMVADADGRNVRPVPGSPFAGMDSQSEFDFEWAADSRSLILYIEPRIYRADAVGDAQPTILASDAVPTGRLGPDGRIPYQPTSIADDALWTVGADGSTPTQLIRHTSANPGGLNYVRYSPDGTRIAFHDQAEGGDHEWRIYVANADGSGVHRLTNTVGMGEEGSFAWSPDGRSIAFNQWTPIDPADPDGDWAPHPISVAAVPDGDGRSPVVELGPSLGAQGADFDWSPDGSALIAIPSRAQIASRLNQPMLIDVATGGYRMLDVTANERATWQRLAP